MLKQGDRIRLYLAEETIEKVPWGTDETGSFRQENV